MRRQRRHAWGIGASALLLALFLLLVGAGAAGARSGGRAVQVSHYPGRHSEVVQAVDGRYVYEAWIVIHHAIGFARSVNGGRTFGPTSLIPDSGSTAARGFHGWDPAVAVAP